MKFWLLLVSLLVGVNGTLVTVLAEEPAHEAKHEGADPAKAPSSFGSPTPEAATVAKEGSLIAPSRLNSCMSDPAVLEEIQKSKDAINEKQKELAKKESELKARELAIQDEIKKIESVRDEINKIDVGRKKENEEKVTKLVETFETMSPKAASILLGSLDESLAIASMARMSTPKLAKVMNIMDPKKASKLTELLAGVVRARSASQSSNDAAETTAESTAARKGGEKK